MQTVFHVLCILLMWAVFQLGSMISHRSEEWSLSTAMSIGDYQLLRKTFFLGGKIIQLAALAWVAVNILALMPVRPGF